MKIIASNKKINRDYILYDDYTAGISLYGSEIKSIRNGDVSITESYISFDEFPVVKQMNIKKYPFSSDDIPEDRERKILLNKSEINKISKMINEKGMSVVVKNIFISKSGYAKLTISVTKGRKKQDKREYEKQKDSIKEVKKFI